MKYFKLFECCQLVLGASKAVLYDLQRRKYLALPKSFGDFLKANGEIVYGEDANMTDATKAMKIGIDYLLEHEYGFLTKHPEYFPEMSMEWDEPSLITNGIIEYSSYLLKVDIWDQLEVVGCEHIEVRIYTIVNIDAVIAWFSSLDLQRVRSIDLIMPNVSDTSLLRLVDSSDRIATITLHGSDGENRPNRLNSSTINYVSRAINTQKCCGVVSSEFFSFNIKSFTESINHNSCLNRKISIDAEGNIKNCPSMTESFGNIRDTTLAEAIEKPGFKKYWDINKDKIHACKDCEFRYVCTDCRAYVEDPEDILSKPLKCGYNPYTGEWEDWSTHPMKQKAIDYYGMRDMVDAMDGD